MDPNQPPHSPLGSQKPATFVAYHPVKTEDHEAALGSPFPQQYPAYPPRAPKYPYYSDMGQPATTPNMGPGVAQFPQMAVPQQLSSAQSTPYISQRNWQHGHRRTLSHGSQTNQMQRQFHHQQLAQQHLLVHNTPHQNIHMTPAQLSHGTHVSPAMPHMSPALMQQMHASPHGHSPQAIHVSPQANVHSQYDFQQLYPIPEGSEPSESRKRARTSDADEGQQLRMLAHSVLHVPVAELAAKVKLLGGSEPDRLLALLNNARDIKQDRHHQLFGMVWVQNLCEAEPAAVVPRNRVYARYVQLCANNNLHPLTPASFGKLVRIVFPNLKTRRLGMRGKSKYHYCGMRLIGDQSNTGLPISSYLLGLDSPQLLNPHTPSFSGSPSVGSLETPFSAPQVQEQFQTNTLRYVPQLFKTIDAATDSMNQPLQLPSLYAYLPKGLDIDYDIADTLHSLYRVHCTSIFELLRYMHISKMFALFPPFPAILTAPVFKLLTSEAAADWVHDCDSVMYRSMLKMLTRLHLQPVPNEVLGPLKEMSREYVNKLSAVLHSKFPKPFVTMKLRLARQFTLMLRRLIRCIDTGASASRVLSNPAERTLMLNDWLRLDMHDIILREVPCARDLVDKLVTILNDDVLKLFADEEYAEGLTKYATFLFELPAQFPRVNPWLFQLVCSNLLTTCLREMSIGGGQSFGSWWILRCWIDEYLSWCFELGGFLYEEFESEFEQSLKHENAAELNTSASFEANTSDQLRSASFVDLLDGLYGDNKPDGDWL